MKKKEIIIIVFAALLFFLFIVMGIFILLYRAEEQDQEIDPIGSFGEYTYMFLGKSEHFSFENGFVLYDDALKKIKIDDFKQIKKIDNLISEEVTIYFNNQYAFSQTSTNNLNEIDKKLDFVYAENGKICHSKDNCEWDAFMLTDATNFKENFKINIKYCTNKNCYDETFKIEYKEKEESD